MKHKLFRKSVVIGILILLFGTSLAVSNTPSIDEKIVNNVKPSETDSANEYLITIEQAQEMIGAGAAILLDVQEQYVYKNINGVLPVLLSDLECESCLDAMFKGYENLIVHSENNAFRTQAANILRGRNYIVYELENSLPINDFPIAYQTYNSDVEILNEEHS